MKIIQNGKLLWEKCLVLTKDGKLTHCAALHENRGNGRCNHIGY